MTSSPGCSFTGLDLLVPCMRFFLSLSNLISLYSSYGFWFCLYSSWIMAFFWMGFNILLFWIFYTICCIFDWYQLRGKINSHLSVWYLVSHCLLFIIWTNSLPPIWYLTWVKFWLLVKLITLSHFDYFWADKMSLISMLTWEMFFSYGLILFCLLPSLLVNILMSISYFWKTIIFCYRNIFFDMFLIGTLLGQ